MTRPAGPDSRPSSTILPPATATSPQKAGSPEPSTMRPFRISRSYLIATPFSARVSAVCALCASVARTATRECPGNPEARPAASAWLRCRTRSPFPLLARARARMDVNVLSPRLRQDAGGDPLGIVDANPQQRSSGLQRRLEILPVPRRGIGVEDFLEGGGAKAGADQRRDR